MFASFDSVERRGVDHDLVSITVDGTNAAGDGGLSQLFIEKEISHGNLSHSSNSISTAPSPE